MSDGDRTAASRNAGNIVHVQVRAEEPSDDQAILAVQAAAFGDAERMPAYVAELRSRSSGNRGMSLVADSDERIVGHVVLSPSRLDAARRLVDVLTLSPLGVLPEYQGRGIGTRLIAEGLLRADSLGFPLVFLEGDPDYYGARGFVRADHRGFRSPSLRIPDEAFQVAILSSHEEWMTGTLVYSETFWAHDAVGLREE